ncbi:MAG: malate synthase A [Thermoanaerobaculia bacterium]|nr:malate synthase A [Thermoanaerobaculia bacterium]
MGVLTESSCTTSSCTTIPSAVSAQAGKWLELGGGVEIAAPAATPRAREILTPEALRLVSLLHRGFNGRRLELLAARRVRQAEWDAGAVPTYLEPSSEALTGSWRVAPIPKDLLRRRVEITGPVNNAKMVINMLSRNAAGDRADMAMLDFEDSMRPTWENVVDGVHNVAGAARGTLSWTQPETAGSTEKVYRLDPGDMAGLMVRVRGLHLVETNLRVDGQPVSGGLFDLALCLCHAAAPLLEAGKTPKLYVPKVEHFLEARFWNDVFVAAQEALGLGRGTLRATFLIETLPAAFQIEEILYELREHAAGLNVGRWDKIFSDIKVLAHHPDRVLADRATIGLNRPWMRDYAQRLVNVCHRRGAFALGGMAAFTPGRTPKVIAEQSAKVAQDKALEARMGHDGCWVSHPYFIGTAISAFHHENQLDVVDPALPERPDLLPVATPPHTLDGLRTNARVGIAYLKGWNDGIGCVAWDGLMEDLATLEISRAQIWQWLHNQIPLDSGQTVTTELVRKVFKEELERILAEQREDLAEADRETLEGTLADFRRAGEQAADVFTRPQLAPFLSELL